jgi:Rrf2 family protein
MFFNLHASQGIHAVGIIAASSVNDPVSAVSLARQIGLCLSSTEAVMRKLKKGGLIRSQHGPGGGYLLQRPVDKLSVWDVVCCFQRSDLPDKTDCESDEGQAALALASAVETMTREYLQGCPLGDVLRRLPAEQPALQDAKSSGMAFYLKPLLQTKPPLTPSWVFDLAKFTPAVHA